MKSKIGFPKICSNETLLNKYYENVSPWPRFQLQLAGLQLEG